MAGRSAPPSGAGAPSRRTIAGGLIAVAMLAGVAIWLAGRSASHADDQPVRAPTATGARVVEPRVERDSPAPPAQPPSSLAGSDPDDDVRADAAGHLIIDLELRRLFDYFLAATGEEPLATIRARIIAVLRARLPASAADEAIAVLAQYLAYRDAARGLTPPADLAASLDQVHDLRMQQLGPVITRAWFAEEEAATYAALARRDAMRDPTLSADERARRLAVIDEQAPASIRAARAAATAPIDELARETAMRAAGASDEQITAHRTVTLGADAAARLAELDHAHAAWNARLAEFRSARAAILAEPQLEEGERRRRVADLLERSFTPQERIRVDALDRLH